MISLKMSYIQSLEDTAASLTIFKINFSAKNTLRKCAVCTFTHYKNICCLLVLGSGSGTAHQEAKQTKQSKKKVPCHRVRLESIKTLYSFDFDMN